MLQYGIHALKMASQNGHLEVVDKLLLHGANVDLQDKVSTVMLQNCCECYIYMNFTDTLSSFTLQFASMKYCNLLQLYCFVQK